MRRRLCSAVALAVVGVAVAGCGGPGPTPPPLSTSVSSTPSASTSTPAASTTATPSVSASPATGTSAGSHPGSPSDRAAAAKTLTGFLDGLKGAATAKSSAALKPLYAASCLWCADQTKSIDLATFLNGSRTGGAVSGATIKYRGVGKQKQLVFDVTMSVSAMKVVDDNGHKQLSSPAVAHGAFTFGIAKSGGRWTIVDGSQGRTSL
jgi:predicted small lipoprotein YifL